MMSTLKAKGCLFLASSLCDGLEDNNIKFLNKEANPNTLIPTYGVTPFHLVIGNDSEAFAEEVTKLFLRHRGNPNVRSADGLTPVHVAAAWGRVTVLELLLANGGDPLCLDDEGRSPFHYAFDGKYYKAIVILGKYCENTTKEEKVIKYKMTFDKLLISSANVIAEYTAPQISNIIRENILNDNIINEYKRERITNIKHIHSFNSSNINVNSDNQFDISAAELQIREQLDKEKFLVNEIINQLSNSLKYNSKEQEINEKYRQCTKNQYDTCPSSTISTDNSMECSVNDKFSLKIKTKKRSITPKYRRKIFGQNNNFKIPLIPLCNPNDSIISKSPNFLMDTSLEKEQRYISPKVPNKEIKFKTFTPCMTRNQSFRSEEFNLGKEMARSTPRRRKRFYRQYSSLRKLGKNYELTSPENTSRDSTNSLSPDFNYARKLDYQFNKNLAVKLHENKYDDDTPISFTENNDYIQSCTFTKDIEGLNNNLKNLKIEETKFKEKNKENLKKYISLEKSFDEEAELKVNNTMSTFKENLNILLSSIDLLFQKQCTVIKIHTFNIVYVDIIVICNSITVNKILYFVFFFNMPFFLYSFKSQSYISVQEAYKYEDADEGVAFLERRIYTLPPCTMIDCTSTEKLWPQSLNLSMNMCLTDETLRTKLINLGDNPGPITNTTRQLYLKRLTKLKNGTSNSLSFEINNFKASSNVDYCEIQMKPFIMYGDWVNDLGRYKIIEKNIFKEFALVSPSRKWREGMNKTCFNYLLLDPRITRDLPSCAENLTKSTVWTTFLSAIFYVGKGTRNRPYSHLKDAFDAWVSNKNSESTKIQHILNIWNAGYGVVCLHIFQNSIPVEAYTREAAMINALGIQKLSNCKSGDYYGIVATWNIEEKCNFGRYLLYQAMQIFLCEGERQIFPQNL
ncbi:Ankyrin repeat and LEM domain-containing protein 1 [Habropoda laboriosa]|uniref:Ankyrin repeat and LEM domain-containing protein 1 n=1 Tax=Habropoda laboriosa TaxID=597456 RepID=A0A0L7R7A0_9HYME|nr:Ankyrin repeat and LEM domain-containing protein 1 [Habropoda laboriosa]